MCDCWLWNRPAARFCHNCKLDRCNLGVGIQAACLLFSFQRSRSPYDVGKSKDLIPLSWIKVLLSKTLAASRAKFSS